jgi:capsular exopolysaccharide synthesis family protein
MESNFKFIENPGEQISNIKDYIYRILSNWRWFLASVLIAFGIAHYVNISTQKQYALTTTIMVDERQNPLFSSGTNISFNWGGVSDAVESIRKALTSRSHNEKVVRELQFYIEYLKEGRFRMEDVYGNTPFIIKLQPNHDQLLNTLIKIEFVSEDKFELSVEFEEDSNYRLINYRDEKQKRFEGPLEKFSRTFEFGEYINLPFLKAEAVKSEFVEDVIGQVFYIRLNSLNAVTSQYRNVRANGLPGTSLVQLVLTGTNKNRIVSYLNKTVEVLAIDKLQDKTNYARNTRAFIDAQFRNTSDSLRLLEDNIGDFKQKNSIYNLSAEGSEIFSQTTSLDKQQLEIKERIQYFDSLETYINTHSDYSKIPAPAIINIEDGSISSMVGKLTGLSMDREKLASEVTANHPSLKFISQEIETTKSVLLENITSLKEVLYLSLESSQKRLNSYNYELTKLPNKEQVLINYQRKYDLTESNYIFLMQKRYEADITIAASVSDISALDPAKDTGQGPILPRKPFNYMVALLLGTIVPLFFIIAKEILDTHVHSSDDIERMTPIPILGVVGKKTTTSNLTVFQKPRSAVAESFRALRSNVHFLFDRKIKEKCKTIIVTSSVSGEGKTFVSINIATVFALGGKKTILVGLDLRKPKMYIDFEIENEIGVVNYLIGEEEQSRIIQKTSVPNLDIIPSGPVPPNPSELLLGTATDELINNLKKEYDYIIIDTPPIGIVSDAVELLKFTDSVMYVVRQKYTQKGMLKLINEKFDKGEVTNISIVLNDFSVKSKYGYEYGYGYGYDGYGKYARGYHDEYKRSILKRILGIKK